MLMWMSVGNFSVVGGAETQPRPGEAGSEPKKSQILFQLLFQIRNTLPGGRFYLQLFAWPGFGFYLHKNDFIYTNCQGKAGGDVAENRQSTARKRVDRFNSFSYFASGL